mgnify:CR=1 FL=1
MARLAKKRYGVREWNGVVIDREDIPKKREWCKKEIELLIQNIKMIESNPDVTKKELTLAKQWRKEVADRIAVLNALGRPREAK